MADIKDNWDGYNPEKDTDMREYRTRSQISFMNIAEALEEIKNRLDAGDSRYDTLCRRIAKIKNSINIDEAVGSTRRMLLIWTGKFAIGSITFLTTFLAACKIAKELFLSKG